MGEFIIMLRNVLMFVALAIPGYILVKCRLLKPEQSGVLSKLLMYLALPFMIFSGVVKNLMADFEAKGYHLDTGCVGTRAVLPVLFDELPDPFELPELLPEPDFVNAAV